MISTCLVIGCGAGRAAKPRAPDCGSYTVTQEDFASTDHRAQQTCLVDAFRAGLGAELTYHYPTVEGDRITVNLHVVGKALVEVRRDETKDPQGSGVVSQRCRRLRADGALLVAGGCA